MEEIIANIVAGVILCGVWTAVVCMYAAVFGPIVGFIVKRVRRIKED